MTSAAVLEQIAQLLDERDEATINTSMRLPVALREAASLAVEHLGLASSTTSLTAGALRTALETSLVNAALEQHFDVHPDARPSLAEVAQALAVQDRLSLADDPELIARAAVEVVAHRPNADADDVLLWAAAQRAAVA